MNIYKAEVPRERGDWDWKFLTSRRWLKQIVQTKGSGCRSVDGRRQGAGEAQQRGFTDTESPEETGPSLGARTWRLDRDRDGVAGVE